MVAYSFAPQFVDQVSTLAKRQTVRAFRKRHARPGEAVQLYTAMRSRHCRKLVEVDPICVDVRRILIDVSPLAATRIVRIEIDGVGLLAHEIEAFAIAYGFDPAGAGDGLAALRMGEFWLSRHTRRSFEGVVIRWERRR